MQRITDRDDDFRKVYSSVGNLKNVMKSSEKSLSGFTIKRWIDFLNTVIDNVKGFNGDKFAKKWPECDESQKYHELMDTDVFADAYEGAAQLKVPFIHKDELEMCFNLFHK